MSDSPIVYLIYGIEDSGRREVLFDLIDGGIPKDEQVLYFRPNDATDSPFDEKIEALDNTSVVDWELADCKIKHGKITAAPTKIVFLAPGRVDPADFAEALNTWMDRNLCVLGSVITIVNCNFIKEHPRSQTWFDACIHFSDIVLLGKRTTVDNRWIKAFEARYTKQYFPCRIELAVKGKAQNPIAVLDTEARRMSLFFDELIPIEEDEFEEDRPEDTQPDPYIERNQSGQRIRPIPDIGKWLN